MKRTYLIFGLTLAIFLAQAAAQITAAVAANVQFAMEELKADFRKSSGVEVKTIYGASGKFASQIRNGAPIDIFVSADMSFPDSLQKWGYAIGKPKPYAYGKLVLWSLKDFDMDKGMAILADSAVQKIAIADPARAPYGREAVKAMQRSGVLEKVSHKLVYGDNTSQVGQYVLTGNVSIGISAKSMVLAPELAGKGRWKEVDSTLYDPIAQGAVICKYGMENNPGLSAKFLTYLYSEPARHIFLKYGYILP
ncbi:MAG: lipoprotein [Fibrobacteres bacterium]|nr:lipoprotein [Fibrobacterota bacterium]